jgi:hypothetical protein
VRINIYAEELPDERAVERVSKTADTGRTYFGARLYLKSPEALHDRDGDDDRSAITFWGPREKVAALLRQLADTMERAADDALVQKIDAYLNWLCQTPKGSPYANLDVDDLFAIRTRLAKGGERGCGICGRRPRYGIVAYICGALSAGSGALCGGKP